MKKNKKKQFTLIELIIVIVVIGILAGIALPKFMGVQRDAKVAALQGDLDVLDKAVLLYNSNSEDNSYPISDKVEKDMLNKTLIDTLAKIGDDSTEIYNLDESKLSPYVSRLKYDINDYAYSKKSNHVIYKSGKIDSKGNIYYLDKSYLKSDGSESSKPNNGSGGSSEEVTPPADITKPTVTLIPNTIDKTDKVVITVNASDESGIKSIELPDGNVITSVETTTYEVTSNGKYTFKVIDNNDNVTTQTITINNILSYNYTFKDNSNTVTYSKINGINYASYNNQTGNSSYQNVTSAYLNHNLSGNLIQMDELDNYDINFISSNQYTTFLVTNNDEVYVCGKGSYGRIPDELNDTYTSFVKVPSLSNKGIKKLTNSFVGGLYIDNSNNLYTWGYGEYGTLGTGSTDKSNHQPTKVTLPDNAIPKEVYGTVDAHFVIDTNGYLYSAGNANSNGLSYNTTSFKKVSDLKVKECAIGDSCLVVLFDDNNVYKVGYGNTPIEKISANTITTPIYFIGERVYYEEKYSDDSIGLNNVDGSLSGSLSFKDGDNYVHPKVIYKTDNARNIYTDIGVFNVQPKGNTASKIK